jgi:hypothetical protein
MVKVIFLFVLICPFVEARSFRDALVGSVNDSAGAAVGVCKIEATNRAKGRAQTAQIRSDGGFSLQSIGAAEQGRNSGANVNLAIKGGSNALLGSLFYFNRNSD